MRVSMYALPGVKPGTELPIPHQPDEIIEKIRTIVLSYYRLTPEKVFKKTRKRECVLARQIMHSLARRYTNHSLERIGEEYPHGSNYDHTSVMHSVKLVRDLYDTDLKFKVQYDHLLALMNGLSFEEVNAIRAIPKPDPAPVSQGWSGQLFQVPH